MIPPQRFAENRQDILLIGMFAGVWQYRDHSIHPSMKNRSCRSIEIKPTHIERSASAAVLSIDFAVAVIATDRYSWIEITHP